MIFELLFDDDTMKHIPFNKKGGAASTVFTPLDQLCLQLTSSGARMSLEICIFLSWSEVLIVGLKNAA